jgi:hypothetical protein
VTNFNNHAEARKAAIAAIEGSDHFIVVTSEGNVVRTTASVDNIPAPLSSAMMGGMFDAVNRMHACVKGEE